MKQGLSEKKDGKKRNESATKNHRDRRHGKGTQGSKKNRLPLNILPIH
jgi:hypothetical protein